jgi:hypothetical protein
LWGTNIEQNYKELKMSDYVSINNGELVPLSHIKKISPITDKERASLAELGSHVDASRFNTRIDFADKRKKQYVPESIEELAAATSGLICIDDNARVFVLADNIAKAKNITDEDREGFKARTGRPMRDDYQSRIETKAGTVLAAIPAQLVMKRMSQPLSGGAMVSESSEVSELAEESERTSKPSAVPAFNLG